MKTRIPKHFGLLSFILFLAGCSSGIQQDVPVVEDVAALAASTVTFQVKASADDAEEPTGRAAAIGSTELELGVDAGVARDVGVRFSGVTIPQGAVIDSAVLEFKAAQSTTTAASFTIAGEASDNAAAYANVAGSIKGRPRTSAPVPWQPTAWTLGSTYRSSDVKGALQQIVNQAGWKSGNAAAFMITGTGIREVVAFDGAAANAPKLVVTYTYDSAPPPPPSGSTALTRVVAQSADDAEEPDGRAAAVGSTVLELGVDTGVPRVVGMRFSNLSIPVGARIDGAVIEMVAAGSNSEPTNLTIAGEASDNAAAYANVAGSISNRLKNTKTGASVAWSPPAWTAGTTHAYRTGELKGILQEIVSRPGWQSGNAAAFMITGTGIRKVAAFESGAAKAPRLVVSYTPQAAPPPEPLNPALEAALKVVETNASFQNLGTALDKNYVYAWVENGQATMFVREQGTSRGFFAIINGDSLLVLLRFEATDIATNFFNVLNGRSGSLDVLTAYGNESGFSSDEKRQAFGEVFIPLLEGTSAISGQSTLVQQAELSLTPQAIGIPEDCIACNDKRDSLTIAEGTFLGTAYSNLFRLIFSGRVAPSASPYNLTTQQEIKDFWASAGAALLSNWNPAAGTTSAYLQYKLARDAYFDCLRLQGLCEPILVGPNPQSVNEMRKVGDSLNEVIVFSNDAKATKLLEFIHNGGNWPGISGPITGKLAPGEQHSIPLQYTCTKVETIDRPIRINTNDPDKQIIDIPIVLECVDQNSGSTRTEYMATFDTTPSGMQGVDTASGRYCQLWYTPGVSDNGDPIVYKEDAWYSELDPSPQCTNAAAEQNAHMNAKAETFIPIALDYYARTKLQPSECIVQGSGYVDFPWFKATLRYVGNQQPMGYPYC